jgi:uncharacterized protein with HEPN domain
MTVYYLPTSDPGKMQWLNNFAAKLPNYREVLSLLEEDVTNVKKWSENFASIIGNIEIIRQYTQQVTAYKNIMRSGSKNNDPLGVMPPAPPTIQLPQGATPDIFGQVQKLVQVIKNSKGYNEAIGKDLGIIGEGTDKAPHEMKPILQVVMQAGHPNIKWKKAGM